MLPVAGPEGGGIFQVGLTMLEALAAIAPPGDEVVVVGDPRGPLADRVRELGLPVLVPPPTRTPPQRLVDRIQLALGRPLGLPSHVDRPRKRRRLARALRGRGIELMVYPWPTAVSFEAGVPYVFTVHDIQHRLQPEFPEVSAGGEWERREYIFRNGLRQATVVIAESETGKEDLLELFGDTGLEPERVMILPYLPATPAEPVAEADRLRVREAYGLPQRFLFYPAAFWPHKNHRHLVAALALLDPDVHLVLTGSRSGDLRERAFADTVAAARNLGVGGRLHHLGLVPEDDLAVLYAEAAALAMPSHFGPSNVPVLEAWALGCPVVTSDLRGLREQAGDAAVLVDPRSPEAIAEGIRRVLDDEQLRTELVERGRRRIAEYTFEDFSARLADIVSAAKRWLPSSA